MVPIIDKKGGSVYNETIKLSTYNVRWVRKR